MTKNLRPASFRGVPFEVESRTVTVGRRTATHEYPKRDIPWVEDMGRKARIYKLEAFVIGADWESIRDRLIAALERGGVGQLVHPDYGTLKVKVPDEVEITQTSAERGKASFSVTFIEAGKELYPQAGIDTGTVLNVSADMALAAEVERFAEEFSVAGSGSAQATAVRDIASVMRALSDGLAGVSGFSPDDMISLLPAPAKLGIALANAITSGVANAQASVLVAADQWRRFDVGGLLGLQRLQQFRRPASGESGVQGTREAANGKALEALVQGVTASALLHGYARQGYVSVEDVESARIGMTAALDEVLYARSGGVDALIDQRTAAIMHLNATGVGLPRLTTIRLLQTLPALVVAYEQHGDVENIDDLLARNKVVHPGFMPAGRDLSILLV